MAAGFLLAGNLASLWFLLLPVLVVGVAWVALAGYTDRLVSQGRYNLALRLVPILAPTGAGRSYHRGNVLLQAGRYDEAERSLRKIADHPAGLRVDTALALEDLGNVLMETGRFEEAQRCFREAAAIFPGRSPSQTGMAELLLRQGIFPQNALRHAETALHLFQAGGVERIGDPPRLGAILATKAWALAACGHGKEALETIDTALKTPARTTKGPLAQVHYKAGMSLLALSDNRAAEGHLARGAKLDPEGRWGRLCACALERQSACGAIGD